MNNKKIIINIKPKSEFNKEIKQMKENLKRKDCPFPLGTYIGFKKITNN